MLSNIFYITLLVSSAHADEGKFSLMTEGKPAPYKGVLFDETATSKLLAMPEKYRLQCDLDMEFQIDKINTAHKLELQNLQLDLDNANKQHEIIVEGKDKQIEKLNNQMQKRIGVGKEWYLVGGIAAGVAITTGMFTLWSNASGD